MVLLKPQSMPWPLVVIPSRGLAREAEPLDAAIVVPKDKVVKEEPKKPQRAPQVEKAYRWRLRGTRVPDSFAVVQVGGHQFKVTEGDRIMTQRLAGPEANDEIVLNKVLLVGTKASTEIGHPLVENSRVYALVEEQTLADKVYIFKKKRRKGYQRFRGHRQEITMLRIGPVVADYPPDLPRLPSSPAAVSPVQAAPTAPA